MINIINKNELIVRYRSGGLSLNIFEAILLSKIVICSKILSNMDITDEYNVFLFENVSYISLIKIINNFLVYDNNDII